MVVKVKNAQFDVKIRHKRLYPMGNGVVGPFTSREAAIAGIPARSVLPHGGETEVSLFDHGACVGTGIAVCSKKDNYCRKTGRVLAIERALSDFANDFVQQVR